MREKEGSKDSLRIKETKRIGVIFGAEDDRRINPPQETRYVAQIPRCSGWET
jgi:uncharacterized protein YigA (DUF484 family)